MVNILTIDQCKMFYKVTPCDQLALSTYCLNLHVTWLEAVSPICEWRQRSNHIYCEHFEDQI